MKKIIITAVLALGAWRVSLEAITVSTLVAFLLYGSLYPALMARIGAPAAIGEIPVQQEERRQSLLAVDNDIVVDIVFFLQRRINHGPAEVGLVLFICLHNILEQLDALLP